MAKRERKTRRDPAKAKKWEKLIREQGKSGKNVREFCRERGIEEGSFYSWRRELRLRKREEGISSLAAVEVKGLTENGGAEIEVRMRGDRSVHVHPGFDEETLRRVVSVLETEGC